MKNKIKKINLHLLWFLRFLPVLVCGCSFEFFNVSSPDTSGFFPMDVNSSGDVVGFERNSAGTANGIVIFHDGNVRSLDSLESGGMTKGFSINDRGDVVGVAELGGREKPVLWLSEGDVISLFDEGEGVALSINNKGEVVGSVLVEDGKTRAFYWGKDVGLLFLLSPNDCSQASSINDTGEIVGSVFTKEGVESACFWGEAKREPLILVRSDSKASAAVHINNESRVVGWLDGRHSSFIWSQEDGVVVLDFKGEIAEAFYLNDRGQVVGRIALPDGSFCSFIWDSEKKGKILKREGESSVAYCLTNDGELLGYAWPFDEKEEMEMRAKRFLMDGYMFRENFDKYR